MLILHIVEGVEPRRKRRQRMERIYSRRRGWINGVSRKYEMVKCKNEWRNGVERDEIMAEVVKGGNYTETGRKRRKKGKKKERDK